ncbi:hypothetical protein L484_001827 [Morus notabilis]|uniref:VQ domain-containing protein n=1 Tax=Morus notabilis TaxID=981085 RepID=W9RHN5_9ROSA|nr:protein MKS1 [Morus notabilis]EXB91953.1 hypothetical protein L484_001827 [Morus notabilis]
MDPSDFPPGKFPRKELQGPRPTPLKISKDSYKIRKPPLAPQPSQPPARPPRQPVIIYDVSPRTIHTNPSDFMDLVQRLTGLPSSSNNGTASTSITTTAASTAASTANPNFYESQALTGAISPAVRYATIEKAKSPQGNLDHDHDHPHHHDHDHMSGLMEGMEIMQDQYNKGLFSGVLSPGPASLPRIPPSFFSPPSDSFFHDLSPLINAANRNFLEGGFMPSPAAAASYFISPRMTSTSTPSIDFLFNNIFPDN